MHIPKTFRLLNRKFSVVPMSDEAQRASETHGVMDLEKGIIQVYPNDNRETTEHTYLHELVHALLETAGRKDLSEDEALVDLVAAALHHYHQTKKGRVYF